MSFFKLVRTRKPLIITSCLFSNDTFAVTVCHSTDSYLHPASIRGINYDKNYGITDMIDVFTHGSGYEGGVGGAYAVYFYGTEIMFKRIKLSKMNSVFQAETIAIKEALVWIPSQKFKDYNIKYLYRCPVCAAEIIKL